MQEPLSSLNLALMARAEANRPQPELLAPQVRTTVRYADIAAWTTTAAVSHLFAPIQSQLASVRDHIGVIVVSDDGPQETMNTVAESARAGHSSPLRFPAAGPCSLAGVVCIAHQLRGPTLNLILPPARGVPAALAVSAGWLHQSVTFVVVAVFARRSSNGLLARCVLLAAKGASLLQAAPFNETDAAWLSLSADGGSTDS